MDFRRGEKPPRPFRVIVDNRSGAAKALEVGKPKIALDAKVMTSTLALPECDDGRAVLLDGKAVATLPRSDDPSVKEDDLVTRFDGGPGREVDVVTQTRGFWRPTLFVAGRTPKGELRCYSIGERHYGDVIDPPAPNQPLAREPATFVDHIDGFIDQVPKAINAPTESGAWHVFWLTDATCK